MILEVGFVSALLLAFGLSKKKPAAETPTPTGPTGSVNDQEAEANACASVALVRPQTYLGRARPVGLDELDWLARVALWTAYPGAPPEPAPDDPVYGPALARLRACLQASAPKPNPVPNPGPVPPIVVPVPAPPKPVPPIVVPVPGPPKPQEPPLAPKPTPGADYQIKKDDTLFAISSAAYGTQGPANLTAARKINDHPYNQRFRRAGIEPGFFGPLGRITLMPHFGTRAQQRADVVKGSEGAGQNFAVIYIP